MPNICYYLNGIGLAATMKDGGYWLPYICDLALRFLKGGYRYRRGFNTICLSSRYINQLDLFVFHKRVSVLVNIVVYLLSAIDSEQFWYALLRSVKKFCIVFLCCYNVRVYLVELVNSRQK